MRVNFCEHEYETEEGYLSKSVPNLHPGQWVALTHIEDVCVVCVR